jgi:hypothetical protein
MDSHALTPQFSLLDVIHAEFPVLGRIADAT